MQQEFNKKFRASDEFKKSVSEDKIESFGKVLQKFFDNEREDYKKDVAMKTPDYDALQKKANQVGIGVYWRDAPGWRHLYSLGLLGLPTVTTTNLGTGYCGPGFKVIEFAWSPPVGASCETQVGSLQGLLQGFW